MSYLILIQECEYIDIKQKPVENKRKTVDYTIVNRKSGLAIGDVIYYNGWRQHVLLPQGNTIWSAGCLDEVGDFLDKLKRKKILPMTVHEALGKITHRRAVAKAGSTRNPRAGG